MDSALREPLGNSHTRPHELLAAFSKPADFDFDMRRPTKIGRMELGQGDLASRSGNHLRPLVMVLSTPQQQADREYEYKISSLHLP